MPFNLVQNTYLNAELLKLQSKENRLAEITSEYEETLDSLSEEEKDSETVNEAKTGFVNSVVVKEAKQFKAGTKKSITYADDSYEAKIIKIDALITEEKAVKKNT